MSRVREKHVPRVNYSKFFFSMAYQLGATLGVMKNPCQSFDYYQKLPSALQNHIFSFFNHRELCRANLALGRVYLENSNIYNRVLKKLPSKKSSIPRAPIPRVGPLLAAQFNKIPQAGKLLHFVREADYEQAAWMVIREPTLMFEHVNFLYPNGRSTRTSPLKEAFRLLDTYMWQLFYEQIKDNSAAVDRFLKQAREQTVHIDLEPLFIAYGEFGKTYQRWKADEVSNYVLEFAWRQLGEVQKAILPVHMLKECARKGRSWNLEEPYVSDFDVTVTPPPSEREMECYTRAYGDKILVGAWTTPAGKCISLSSYMPSGKEWGDYALVRGSQCFAGRVSPVEGTDAFVHDAAIFLRLYEVRVEDFFKRMSFMNKSHPQPSRP